jgi:hypothetical protein
MLKTIPMKNTILFCGLWALLLSVSISALAQYSGTNPNVALLKVATASDTVVDHGPELAVDDLPGTYCSIQGDTPSWLAIDLYSEYIVDGYGLILSNTGELPTAFTFQGSTDGETWTDLADTTLSATGTYSYDLPDSALIRFVRLLITAKDEYASISEIRVYGELQPPAAPTATAADNITATGFRARWYEVSNADGYRLDISINPSFTTYVDFYHNFDVGLKDYRTVSNLIAGTTYYYRVRSYNSAGSSENSNIRTVTTLKLPQSITFNTLDDKTYGDADMMLTGTATSGLTVTYTSSDLNVATVSGNVVTLKGAGTTTITASQAGNAQYEPATPVNRDLLVGKKQLTVIETVVADKPYDGTTDAALSGATLSGVVGTDDVTLTGASTGTFAQSSVGTGIPVTTSMTLGGPDENNYLLVQPSDLSGNIVARNLTVTAEDKVREECEANPGFTVNYAGFAGTEDASVFTSLPVASCDADESSPAGTYDITVTGGSASNYNLIYVTGTLTVTPDSEPPSLTVHNITVQLDVDGNASITPADLVTAASDNCELADTTLSQSDFTNDDVGQLVVYVTVTDAAGNSTSEAAIVTVEAAPSGIREIPGASVTIYPNPASDVVHIDLNAPATLLKVMDMTGKVILNRSNPKLQETIDLSRYPSGIYIFQIHLEETIMHYPVRKR